MQDEDMSDPDATLPCDPELKTVKRAASWYLYKPFWDRSKKVRSDAWLLRRWISVPGQPNNKPLVNQ